MSIKKEAIVLFVLILLPISLAQDPGILPTSPLYGVEKAIDNINLATKTGEDKAITALQIKKERLAEAQFLIQQGIKVDVEDVEEAILDAQEKAEVVEKEVTPKIQEEVKKDSKETITTLKEIKEDLKKISAEENITESKDTEKDFVKLEKLINKNIAQEEKIRIASDLVKNIGDYCEKLAMQDYSLMESDEKCDPEQEDIPDWLKELIKKDIAEREEQAKQEMISQLTTCVMDPRQCDCSKIPVKKHQQECEENTALAIKCEYEEDMSACDELQSKPIVPEDMPAFLKPFFESTMKDLIAKKEEQMFKKFAPPECIEANARTRDACESLMREKYGEPPEECKDVRSKEECESRLIAAGKIPPECIENGKVISQEECMNKMIPEPCKQAGAFTREECERIMTEFYQIEGPPSGEGPPPECMKDSQFIGQEECEAIMKEKFAEGSPGEEKEQRCNANEDCIRTICPAAIGMDTPTCENNKCCCGNGKTCKAEEVKEEKTAITQVAIPQYGKDEVLVSGENGTELIKIEEIKQIITETEQIVHEEIGHTEETLALQQEIQELEQDKQKISEVSEEEIKGLAEQIEEKIKEETREETEQPRETEEHIIEQPKEEQSSQTEQREQSPPAEISTPIEAVTGSFLKIFNFFQENLNK